MMILVNQYIRYLLLYLLLLFTSCSDTLTIIDGYTMGTTYTVSIHNSFLSEEKINTLAHHWKIAEDDYPVDLFIKELNEESLN